ncbi:MAG: NAD(P)/FAD-dependent oxidoreductase [Myxococcota bacterium]
MPSDLDAVIIGSGPNGLAAAIRLAQAGLRVHVIEAKERPGGGMRTEELTLPGFHHDVCSACHPMGVLSPYLKTLPLDEHGLEWVFPEASFAHPLDDEPAVMLYEDVERTAAELGNDSQRYRRLVAPFLRNPEGLLADGLAPLRIPNHPILLARFGLRALRSAMGLARGQFKGTRAQALFAGCAGHGIVPLDFWFSAAIALIFLVTGHVKSWPVARGGSESIARAMVSFLRALGGTIETDRQITSARELPAARAYLFDTSPAQLSSIAGDLLPPRYHRRLDRYRYGPGVFKVDWALSERIPWRDERVHEASTVHLGGTLEEIAAAERDMWEGRHSKRPYMILVQQSNFDRRRAPDGKHTGYAYCHVPANSTEDLTDVLESQIERFAPGFRDIVEAKVTRNTTQWQKHNANYVGGAITGGVADMWQLFTRPVARLNPYTTPNRHLFICSASTPPGGGVHGMCGFHAAETVLKRLGKLPVLAPS